MSHPLEYLVVTGLLWIGKWWEQHQKIDLHQWYREEKSSRSVSDETLRELVKSWEVQNEEREGVWSS